MLRSRAGGANTGQPTVGPGATGDVVRRAQRALRRTPDLGVVVDGVYGPATEAAVKAFQKERKLRATGIVNPKTWAALPEGAPMPTLKNGSRGMVVARLQNVLAHGAGGEWGIVPGPVDGDFGPSTKAAVAAFQRWGGVRADGVVSDLTWSVPLRAVNATLESAVGLDFAAG